MNIPLRIRLSSLFFSASLAVTALAGPNSDPFLGRWALTIPGGGPGWLQVTKEKSYYDASILWGGGSVVPVSSVCFEGDVMWLTRVRQVQRKDAAGKVIRTQQIAEAILARVEGDTLSLTQISPHEDGESMTRAEFSGKRIPDVPPAPDLTKVQFGPPIELFNGKDLTGWKLVEANAKNGWRVENGELVNDQTLPPGQNASFGNLRTEREFEDFNLKLETNVPKDGNSGVYLRGLYEVQVADTFGKPADPHNMGAIYSRITPTATVEKPAGEWQTLEITLLDRHVTVILNGTKIIDNQPLQGCTGGALTSDEFHPGPIYLQGDHTGIRYRNIVIRPIVK